MTLSDENAAALKSIRSARDCGRYDQIRGSLRHLLKNMS